MAAAGVERKACARLLQGLAVVLAGLLCACAGPKKSGALAAHFTPKTRYILKVNEVVDKQWHLYLQQRKGDASFGWVEVGFMITPKGKVEKMRVMSTKGASPDMIRLSLNAVRDAKLPRMPADVISTLTASDKGCLTLYYRANIPPPTPDGRGAAPSANLTAKERAAWEARVQWSKEHLSTQGYHQIAAPGGGSRPKAAQTPTERYTDLALGKVDTKWNLYRKTRLKELKPGSLKVFFYLNKQGKVEELKVVDDKKSYPMLTETILQAIRDAEIPRMPADVIAKLLKKDQGRVPIHCYVLIY